MGIEEQWIQYMMDYYRKVWPKHPEYQYRIWSENAIRTAVHSLGDYYSRSSYNV